MRALSLQKLPEVLRFGGEHGLVASYLVFRVVVEPNRYIGELVTVEEVASIDRGFHVVADWATEPE